MQYHPCSARQKESHTLVSLYWTPITTAVLCQYIQYVLLSTVKVHPAQCRQQETNLMVYGTACEVPIGGKEGCPSVLAMKTYCSVGGY